MNITLTITDTELCVLRDVLKVSHKEYLQLQGGHHPDDPNKQVPHDSVNRILTARHCLHLENDPWSACHDYDGQRMYECVSCS